MTNRIIAAVALLLVLGPHASAARAQQPPSAANSEALQPGAAAAGGDAAQVPVPAVEESAPPGEPPNTRAPPPPSAAELSSGFQRIGPTAVVPSAPPASELDDARISPMAIAAYMHMSNRIQNLRHPSRLDRISQENEFNLLFNAQIISMLGLTLDLAGRYGPTSPRDASIDGELALLDLIGKLDLHELFHLWLGRMLVPSDRANFSGVWFASAWNYPGRYYGPSLSGGVNHFFGAPLGPRQGPYGRNDGATLWGEVLGGVVKYYAGVYDLFGNQRPLLSGRVNLALFNPEPGYYHSSTYFGAKNILALGVSAQYQKQPNPGNAYAMISGDVLFERNLGESGTIDVEAAFYKYFANDTNYNYYALASYLTPGKIGAGALQPLVRLQQAKPAGGGELWTIIDAQLGYVIEAYAAKIAWGYEYQHVETVRSHALILGLQLQK